MNTTEEDKKDEKAGQELYAFGCISTYIYCLLFFPLLLFTPYCIGSFSIITKKSILLKWIVYLFCLSVPLSIPTSIYALWQAHKRKKYSQTLFFTLLPILLWLLRSNLVDAYDRENQKEATKRFEEQLLERSSVPNKTLK